MKKIHLLLWLCLATASNSFATEKATLRIGVQTGGTLEWELSAFSAESTDFTLQTQSLANPEAAKIALQSGAVDIIVSDWLWVANLRSQGQEFSFYPYSSTAGALVVAANSPIKSLSDLSNKKLGIAGGELDKNWLLLQTLAQQQNINLNNTEKTFGAPPLITEQLKQNRIDAALTYWHFAAKLEANGYRTLIDGKGILQGLGIKENVPTLGYVFKQNFAEQNTAAIDSFFNASAQAKKQLCIDDAAWQKVIPLTKVEDAPTQKQLRQRYCEGSVEQWGEKQQQAAAYIYTLLKKISNDRLTGNAPTLPTGTFWNRSNK